MRKKLLLVAVCILGFPFAFSDSKSDKLANSTPYSAVALAGHNTAGGWCQCGCFACICDEGEQAGLCGQSAQAVSDTDSGSNQVNAPDDVENPFSFDFGSGALLMALASFVWARSRA